MNYKSIFRIFFARFHHLPQKNGINFMCTSKKYKLSIVIVKNHWKYKISVQKISPYNRLGFIHWMSLFHPNVGTTQFSKHKPYKTVFIHCYKCSLFSLNRSCSMCTEHTGCFFLSVSVKQVTAKCIERPTF